MAEAGVGPQLIDMATTRIVFHTLSNRTNTKSVNCILSNYFSIICIIILSKCILVNAKPRQRWFTWARESCDGQGVKGVARTKSPIDVFRYLDYRRFLGDVYKAQKARGLSYRAFSRRAALGAPNYLKLVVEGKRNLTPGMALRFAHAAGLAGDGADYFVELVAFCQADTNSEKQKHHQRLLAFSRYREAHKLENAHAEYHAAWYLPAIRELVTSRDFRDDPKWIATKLWPAIKASEAKQALAILLKLGLIARDGESGRLRQTSAIVTTGPETRGLHIARYHAEMTTRAIAAIDLVPSSERDLSALTLCVGKAGLARMKQRIQALRRELLELNESDDDRDQVVQLNFQLFPLTRAEIRAKKAVKNVRSSRRDADDDEV
jgi:uncharacterized protein (TIGR02147 family)